MAPSIEYKQRKRNIANMRLSIEHAKEITKRISCKKFLLLIRSIISSIWKKCMNTIHEETNV